ncbi:MAG TPA: helix-turn-helix domain-containing protein [Solirubrobacteraceae bacterium]|nr:helix-turn-helix domain-containing protein [Solirubrobacteraceae bacterium]
MSEPAETRTLSVTETAQVLGRSEAYVRELIATGALRAETVVGEPRIPLAHLEQYLERRARHRRGIREISRLVDESPGGWEQ